MAADWTDDHRRAWAVNGVREEIRELRARARRARVRFPDGLYFQPAAWCAEAYEAAADALQECIDDLPKPEPSEPLTVNCAPNDRSSEPHAGRSSEP